MGIKRTDGTWDFEGAVLSTFETYLGHDRYADYARVWDGEAVVTIQYGAGYLDMSSGANGYERHAVADASEATRQAADAWKREQDRQQAIKDARARYEREMGEVSRGKLVKVVRGRKVPKGTIGEVFWLGANRFGPGYRAGLRIDGQDEPAWIDAAYLEVIRDLDAEDDAAADAYEAHEAALEIAAYDAYESYRRQTVAA